MEYIIPFAMLLTIAILLLTILLGYRRRWRWTGLTGYYDDDGVYRTRNKTLWDWMDLLLIPAVLALGGYWFQQTSSAAEQQATEKRVSIDREIAEDNFRATTLQNYLANMSDLLIKEGLLQAEEGSGVQSVARSMTLTTLRRLDSIGKGSVIGFLSESGLVNVIRTDSPIIDLSEQDLSKTHLHYYNLSGANLELAILSGAYMLFVDLSKANLKNADLSGADLRYAILSGANLNGANLVGADLSDADLQGVNLSEAKYSKKTKWPNGFVPPRDAVLVE